MKVSVVVPVFNMEAYLGECLQSLVDQTLGAIEIIVVNDGSTDGSQAIIDDFSERFPERIRAFTKANGGLSDARNFGIDRACGEYVGFVDSDDFVDPRMFARLHAEAARLDADIAACPVTHVYAARHVCRYLPPELESGRAVADAPELLLALGSYAWNKLYRRALLSARSFRFPAGQLYEDSATVYNILLDANRIALVDAPFYRYRRERPGSITASPDARVFDVFRSCDSILRHFRAHPRYGELAPYVDSLCVKHVMARYKALWQSGTPRLAFAFASRAMRFFEQELGDWKATQWFDPRRKSKADLLLSRLLMQPLVLAGFLALPKGQRALARRPWRRARRTAGRKRGRRHPLATPPATAATPPDASAIAAALDAQGITHFVDGNATQAVGSPPMVIGVVDAGDAMVREAMDTLDLRLRRQYLLGASVAQESYAGGEANVEVVYFARQDDALAGWMCRDGDRRLPRNQCLMSAAWRRAGFGRDQLLPPPADADYADKPGRCIEFEHVTGKTWTPMRSRSA